MITFFNDSHHAHAPEFQFYRGERVPCFGRPAREEFVKTSLVERGHALQPAQVDNRPPGHHVGADFMDGYRFPNNSAVGAQALRNSAAARVAVLDVDTFADDPISQFPNFSCAPVTSSVWASALASWAFLPCLCWRAATQRPSWATTQSTSLKVLSAFELRE